jgi:hypothetical protein
LREPVDADGVQRERSQECIEHLVQENRIDRLSPQFNRWLVSFVSSALILATNCLPGRDRSGRGRDAGPHGVVPVRTL